MSNDVLVLAEYRTGTVDNLTLQVLGKGREVADGLGGRLALLVVGCGLQALAGQLTGSGADVVLVADHPSLKDHRPEVYSGVVGEAVKHAGARLLLLGHSYHGMEIGTAVATMLKSTMVTNCVDIEVCDGTVNLVRPMFGGILQSRIELNGPAPAVVSFQRGAWPLKTLPPRQASTERLAVATREADAMTRLIEVLQPPEGDVDIAKAEIIVSVGRGIAEKANISLAREAAQALGGVVACSRPLSDMGWLPAEYHVGVTGRVVRPKVYIACGISGAAQHLAGMQDAQLIIAINKDRDAPIFHVAHYGVVGDVLELLPAIAERARAAQLNVAGRGT